MLNLLLVECENLIKHMLVRDPKQRYTIEQIRNHEWLRMDLSVQGTLDMNNDLNSETDSEPEEEGDDEKVYNERALRLMENLGIDIPTTKKVFISVWFFSAYFLKSSLVLVCQIIVVLF